MKDYYYFLGLPQNATAEEIKKIYRKLSVKYHPDKNDNDAFFENRFREVQEAYDILIDENKRKNYDQLRNQQKKIEKFDAPPIIKSFNTNKKNAKKDDFIIITWNTINADIVKIIPLGLVESYGERKIKISNFSDGKFQLILQAMNSHLNIMKVHRITINQEFNIENTSSVCDIKENKTEPTLTNKQKNSQNLWIIMIIIIIFVIIIISIL